MTELPSPAAPASRTPPEHPLSDGMQRRLAAWGCLEAGGFAGCPLPARHRSGARPKVWHKDCLHMKLIALDFYTCTILEAREIVVWNRRLYQGFQGSILRYGPLCPSRL